MKLKKYTIFLSSILNFILNSLQKSKHTQQIDFDELLENRTKQKKEFKKMEQLCLDMKNDIVILKNQKVNEFYFAFDGFNFFKLLIKKGKSI